MLEHVSMLGCSLTWAEVGVFGEGDWRDSSARSAHDATNPGEARPSRQRFPERKQEAIEMQSETHTHTHTPSFGVGMVRFA